MARTYGASGIAIYWIVNLVDRQIEVYTSPTSDGYRVMQVYKPGEQVPVVLDGTVVGMIAVSDMLP
jgi:Putative restriction endonuclease